MLKKLRLKKVCISTSPGQCIVAPITVVVVVHDSYIANSSETLKETVTNEII